MIVKLCVSDLPPPPFFFSPSDTCLVDRSLHIPSLKFVAWRSTSIPSLLRLNLLLLLPSPASRLGTILREPPYYLRGKMGDSSSLVLLTKTYSACPFASSHTYTHAPNARDDGPPWEHCLTPPPQVETSGKAEGLRNNKKEKDCNFHT